MTNRQVRFISRIIVVTIVAAVAGLAARIAFKSTELVKVIGEGGLRDLLILASPVSTLVLLQYSLAIRSHGIRDLSTEGLAFVPPLCIFLLITLPFYFSAVSVETMTECAWWKVFGCRSEVSRPNYWIGIAVLLAAILSIRELVHREKSRPTHRSGEA